jgi:nucleoside-diphosphate-sugar epimerase
MGIRVIITGVTGMVGEGVLLECLQNHKVDSVLVICRKPLSLTHPKLKIFVVPNFLNVDGNANELKGYDACFYCAGVSSNGVSEEDYTKITYETTLHFAAEMLKANSDVGSHKGQNRKCLNEYDAWQRIQLSASAHEANARAETFLRIQQVDA